MYEKRIFLEIIDANFLPTDVKNVVNPLNQPFEEWIKVAVLVFLFLIAGFLLYYRKQ